MRYNPAFDGVRAIAVIAVIGFHWQLPGFWGGFFGVDVFFVLSGFLITGLIAAEIDRTGRLSLPRFYVRRLLRLSPQLLLLLAAYLVVMPLATPIPLREHVVNAVLVATYVSDYSLAFWHRPMTLPHTWSLSVEEHYYLIWPVAVLLLLPVAKPRRLLTILIVSYVAATGWRIANLWLFDDLLATAARFDTRMSGLILGGIVALMVREGMTVGRPDALGAAALGILVIYFVTSNHGEIDSLSWRMIVVELAAAALIVSLACGRGMVARLLSLKWLVAIGLISYGLYLWHMPVWMLLYSALDPVPRHLTALAISLALAGGSYLWIERPMRKLRHRLSPAAR